MSRDAAARPAAGGILVEVRLTPRGGRDAFCGGAMLADGRPVLLARVRAVPEKGEANAALVALAAEAFGVTRSSVAVVAGQSARLKTLRIAGDAATLAKRASALAE